jgi:hypothetical protein
MSNERTDWHADAEALRGLVDGSIGPVLAASLESHVMRCPDCRKQLNTLAYTDPLEETWTAIRESVQAPPPGLVERALRRCGVSEESGRLLAAVPAMRAGWLLGVATVLAFAGIAALFSHDVGISLFLLVAPLTPVAGVAAAFGGDADPTHEIVTTTPYSAGRLLLLRTLAVLATCSPIAMVVGFALPGPAWLTVAWLSPAVAGIGVTLALALVLGLNNAGAAVGLVWAMATLAVSKIYDPLLLIGPVSQSVCLALVICSGAALFTNSQTLDLPRRLS